MQTVLLSNFSNKNIILRIEFVFIFESQGSLNKIIDCK